MAQGLGVLTALAEDPGWLLAFTTVYNSSSMGSNILIRHTCGTYSGTCRHTLIHMK